MAKARKQKTDPQGGELQATKKPQELTPEQRKLYLRRKEREADALFYKRLERGDSLETIIKGANLEGVTPEQLQEYVDEGKIIAYLCDREGAGYVLTEEEIAADTGIELRKVEEVASTFRNEVSALQEQGKSAEEIAETTGLRAQEIEDFANGETLLQRVADFVPDFCNGYTYESMAEYYKLEEDEAREVVEDFKEKVLHYYTQEQKTIEQIAELTRLSSNEIITLIEEKEDEVKNLQAVKMQTLIQTRKAGRRDRMERLTDLRDLLIGEIKQRGLAEVSVDKIVALYLKTEEAIGRETKEIPSVVTSSKSSEWDKREFSVL